MVSLVRQKQQSDGVWKKSRAIPWSGSSQITPSRGSRSYNAKVKSVDSHLSNDAAPSVAMKAIGTPILQRTTTVVNVRKAELQKLGFKDLQEWVTYPDHIYIGRDMTRYVPGAVGSKWGNPFASKKDSRDERCNRYREYILLDTKLHENGKTLLQSLDELKGKTLGCWCHPERCHGHELVKLITEHCK